MIRIKRVFIVMLCICLLSGFGACSPASAPNTRPTTYQATFVATDATGAAPDAIEREAGKRFSLPENTFTKDGFTFAGWSDGSAVFDAGARYEMPARNVEFSATWSVARKSEELDYLPMGAGNGTAMTNSDTANAPKMGDPFLYYDEPTETFYLYGTTSGDEGFKYYTSKDLSKWTAQDFCYRKSVSTWADQKFWAPEMHKINGRFWLYYTGQSKSDGKLHGSVAVADSPAGPFSDVILDDTGAVAADGTRPLFDFGFPSIDGTAFLDDDGELYYYFAKDQVYDAAWDHSASTIWGVKLSAPYATDGDAVQLTSIGHSTVNAEGPVGLDQAWEVADRNALWNEGPFMLKQGDRYYLTYSANFYDRQYYGVGYAVSYAPLSDFVKPADSQLMGVDGSDYEWNYFSGSGHHMFLSIKGENFAVYHRHVTYGGGTRCFAIDRYGFDADGRLYINGPTVASSQPLPAALGGLSNCADKARVTVDGIADADILTDGAISTYRKYSAFRDYNFEAGEHTVKLTWTQAQRIQGIVLYNTTDYARRCIRIDRVTWDSYEYVTGLAFSSSAFNAGVPYVQVGSNASALLSEPIEAKSITVKVSADRAFALSEIVILKAVG